MSPLFKYNGTLLNRGGGLANNENCCCTPEPSTPEPTPPPPVPSSPYMPEVPEE